VSNEDVEVARVIEKKRMENVFSRARLRPAR